MRGARISRGLTQQDVGRLVGAREAQISDWERGKVMPKADVLERYVRADLLSPLRTSGDAA